MSASALIADVRSLLTGDPVFLAGSLVAEEAYGKATRTATSTCSVPTSSVLIASGRSCSTTATSSTTASTGLVQVAALRLQDVAHQQPAAGQSPWGSR